MVIVANIIGFIASIISLISYHKKTKEKIFKSIVLANVLNIIQYLLLDAESRINN